MILNEGHKNILSLHPSLMKMSQYLKKSFWWYSMKVDVVHYASSCITCKMLKVENQKSDKMFQ